MNFPTPNRGGGVRSPLAILRATVVPLLLASALAACGDCKDCARPPDDPSVVKVGRYESYWLESQALNASSYREYIDFINNHDDAEDIWKHTEGCNIEWRREMFLAIWVPFRWDNRDVDPWVLVDLPIYGTQIDWPADAEALMGRHPPFPGQKTVSYTVNQVWSNINPTTGQRHYFPGVASRNRNAIFLSGYSIGQEGVATTILAHELGHILGLEHVTTPGQESNLMWPVALGGRNLTLTQCAQARQNLF